MDEKKERVGKIMMGLLLGTAALFDIVQFLLEETVILPTFVGWIAMALFATWFSVLGVSYFSGKRAGLKLLGLFGPVVISVIPFINGLPDIILGVTITIMMAYAEDKELVPAKLAPLKKIYRGYRNQDRIQKDYGVPIEAQPAVPTTTEDH